MPPASSKPFMPGGRKWVGMSPMSGPPRARRIALRSKPASTARRTLRSSNGLIVVFRLTMRQDTPGTRMSWLLRDVLASLSAAGGGDQSPLIMCEPVRILREDTLVSSLPCGISNSSR